MASSHFIPEPSGHYDPRHILLFDMKKAVGRKPDGY
jgi:hypothetical protein